ncbi:hypothetical protein ACFE04_024357 [Oxalis oulophora]
MAEEVKTRIPVSLLKKIKREGEWVLANNATLKKNQDSRSLIFERAISCMLRSMPTRTHVHYPYPWKNLAAIEAKTDFQWRIPEGQQSNREYVAQGGTICHLRVYKFEKCEGIDLQEALEKHDIISVEDLIHEIMSVGPHFKEANNFLWPFQLKAPLGGLKKKRNHYVEGGDAGNRENYINELTRRVNLVFSKFWGI